jgi:hypothetical protein
LLFGWDFQLFVWSFELAVASTRTTALGVLLPPTSGNEETAESLTYETPRTRSVSVRSFAAVGN